MIDTVTLHPDDWTALRNTYPKSSGTLALLALFGVPVFVSIAVEPGKPIFREGDKWRIGTLEELGITSAPAPTR